MAGLFVVVADLFTFSPSTRVWQGVESRAMNDSEFRCRAISAFHNLEYVFMEDLEQGREVERLPTGQQAAVKAAMFAASGVLGALGTRYAKSAMPKSSPHSASSPAFATLQHC